jgi:hypothetical protein
MDKIPPTPTDGNALRAWRMQHNPTDYPQDNSYHEGFAGVVGCVIDRWCRECQQRIDVPHLPHCSIAIKERQLVGTTPCTHPEMQLWSEATDSLDWTTAVYKCPACGKESRIHFHRSRVAATPSPETRQ